MRDWETMDGDCSVLKTKLAPLDYVVSLDILKYTDELDRDDIDRWCKENCTGSWDAHRSVWYFESASDAALFTLRFHEYVRPR